MAVEHKKDADSVIEATSGKTQSRFPELTLSELSSYLSWDCPLNDTSLVALIARLIIEYAGDNSTVTILGNTSKLTFEFDCGCVSNDGMFYGIHSHSTYYYDYSGMKLHAVYLIANQNCLFLQY